MDFPKYEKGAALRGDPVQIETSDPEKDRDLAPHERLLAQQWRDAQAQGLGELHPLSLNRDDKRVKPAKKGR